MATTLVARQGRLPPLVKIYVLSAAERHTIDCGRMARFG